MPSGRGRPVVDVDRAETWPEPVAAFVSRWAKLLAGTTTYTCDLGGVDLLEADEQFRMLLRNHLVRAYHCTRLMEHEISMIRERGLVPLDESLVKDKLAAALRHGAIDQPLHDALVARHVLTHPEQAPSRLNQVCLVLSRRTFDHSARSCVPLLEIWGGEAINWRFDRTDTENVLRSLGKPSIVSADIDLGQSGKIHFISPSLSKVFVASRLGFDDIGADVFYSAPVPPEAIDGIWQPGHPEYDRHGNLPAR